MGQLAAIWPSPPQYRHLPSAMRLCLSSGVRGRRFNERSMGPGSVLVAVDPRGVVVVGAGGSDAAWYVGVVVGWFNAAERE